METRVRPEAFLATPKNQKMLVGDSQFVDDLSEKLGLKPRPSAGVHFHECEHQKPSPTFVEIILNMHIIWKRPDGFENAQPSDFFKISLSNGAQLWLHHYEKEWYPFQVQGGWEGQGETQRLNQLINLLGIPRESWPQHIDKLSDIPVGNEEHAPINKQEFANWLREMSTGMKGHTWELEVIRCACEDVSDILSTTSILIKFDKT